MIGIPIMSGKPEFRFPDHRDIHLQKKNHENEKNKRNFFEMSLQRM